MTDMLYRSVPPFEMRASEDDGDGLTLEGYGAVFNTPTRIDSWEGCFDEQIAKGAFKRSLKERTPVLQFDHGRHPYVGSIPIGSFDKLREDESGLFVSARLHDNDLVKPVRQAIESQAISGMSFRFSVTKDEWRTADGALVKPEDVSRLLWKSDRANPATILSRTLREVALYEVGPVVFPAYAETSVGVRSRELISLLSDPQARAEAARFLAGTPSEEPRDAEGASGDEVSGDAEPEATRNVPSPAARARALKLSGVIR